MEKPKTFITGGNGFSGQHITKYLHEKSYTNLLHMGHMYGDLTRTRNTEELPTNVDVLIHTAGISPSLNKGPSQLIDNIKIAKNLIHWAKGSGQVQKIIFFSSVSLFGEVLDGLLTNNSPRINPSVYGETKHICEEMLFDSGIPTISLRLPAVVGKGAQRHKIAHILDIAKRGKIIYYHSPNALFNNVVHIHFLCELIELLIQAPNLLHYESILLGSTEPIAMIDVILHLTEPFGNKSKLQMIPNVGPPNFIVETTNLSQFLEPWTTQQTLQRYVDDEI